MWDGTVRRKRIITMPDGSPFGKEIDVGGVQKLCEFIDRNSYGASEIAKKGIDLAKELRPQLPPNQSLRDLIVNRMWGLVNTMVTYVDDKYYVDYWNEASETYADRTGDCEDCAILLTSALRYLDIPAKLCIGYYIHEGQWYGHAFVTYDCEMLGKKVVLETTWDEFVSPNTWIVLEGSHYHITVEADENVSEQKCSCTHCQEMIDYLSTEKALPHPKMHKVGKKPNDK